MPDFTFRIRFQFSPNERLMVDAPEWCFPLPGSDKQVRIVSRDGQSSIQNATELIAVSRGWASQAEAQTVGERLQLALTVALTRIGIGVDFGRRMPQGWFTTFALGEMSQRAGRPVHNDTPGLMVYETDPAPQLVGVGSQGYSGRGLPQFQQALSAAVANPHCFSERERIAFDFLNSSFFEGSNETRFLSLVMAVEVLLEPRSKSEAGCHHVENLMVLTQDAKNLTDDERNSLLSTLGWMKTESIGQAGRRLTKERLGDREYNGMKAPKFFSHFYNLRSRLVHGAVPAPSSNEVGAVVHGLRMFVSDLMTSHLWT